METMIIVVFVLGYIGIALEHPLKINKTAIAILTGVLCWTLFVLAGPSDTVTESSSYSLFFKTLSLEKGEMLVQGLSESEIYSEFVVYELSEHLSSISQILFFLMGAMTIVELVDAHHGFRFITDRVKTK
jgi:hypothetical protein